MSLIPNIIHKGRPLARLANAAFLLSIILLSGHVPEGSLWQQPPAQTEVTVAGSKSAKSTVYYSRALFARSASDFYSFDATKHVNLSLLQYGRSIATNFRSALKQCLAIRKQEKVPSLKYSPRKGEVFITHPSRG